MSGIKLPSSFRPTVRSGLVGIEKKIQSDNEGKKQKISEAFQDIESLIDSAKPMLDLIKNISDEIKDVKEDGESDDDTIKFRRHLLSLGIKDPVTKSKFGSGATYFSQLAKEISITLADEIERRGGIMSLVEVFLIMNRARGLKLVSPEDILNACQNFESLKSPLRLKNYGKGVRVLQHDCFNDDFCITTVLSLLETHGYITAEKYANNSKIPLLVANYILKNAERLSVVCRDETVEGLKFYSVDPFKNYFI